MIRAQHLRVKSLQAEVAYLQDLKRLNDVAQAEKRGRHLVADSRERFWSRALLARTTISTNRSPSTFSPLERIWQAHKELERATREYAGQTQTLRSEVTRLSVSRERLDFFTTLVAKQQKLQLSRMQSRLSEELCESAVSLSARAATPDLLTAAVIKSEEVSFKTPTIRGGKPIGPPNTPPLSDLTLEQPCVSRKTCTGNRVSLHHSGSFCPIRVSALSSSHLEGRPSLSLQCVLHGGEAIGVSLARDTDGAIHIELDVHSWALRNSIAQERRGLLTRLKNMGLKIASVELGLPSGADWQRATSSKRSRKEDDENIIA